MGQAHNFTVVKNPKLFSIIIMKLGQYEFKNIDRISTELEKDCEYFTCNEVFYWSYFLCITLWWINLRNRSYVFQLHFHIVRKFQDYLHITIHVTGAVWGVQGVQLHTHFLEPPFIKGQFYLEKLGFT